MVSSWYLITTFDKSLSLTAVTFKLSSENRAVTLGMQFDVFPVSSFPGLIYGNLVLSGSNAKIIYTNDITVVGNLSIAGTAKASLDYAGEGNVNSLKLGGVEQIAGTWGSSASGATYKNDTYFANNIWSYGVLKVATGPVFVSAANSSVVASPTSVVADGSTTSTITVTLRDSSSNPASGKTVTLAAGGGSSIISTSSGPSDDDGVVTFTVTNTEAESVTYTATVDSVTISQTATVNFTSMTTTKTWTGNISTDWFNADNWNPSGVPGSTNPVVIGTTSAAYWPVVGGNDASCASITFANTNYANTLTVASGYKLTVTGVIELQNASDISTGAKLAGDGTITCGSVKIGGNNWDNPVYYLHQVIYTFQVAVVGIVG